MLAIDEFQTVVSTVTKRYCAQQVFVIELVLEAQESDSNYKALHSKKEDPEQNHCKQLVPPNDWPRGSPLAAKASRRAATLFLQTASEGAQRMPETPSSGVGFGCVVLEGMRR